MTDKMHIAIVDDDQALLDGLNLYLTSHGAKVSCFSESPEFLAAITAGESFDCVICDIRMPGLSGLEILDRLNRIQYKRPIIMITGRGDVPMAVSAIKKGAFDFIDKPFDPSQLFDSVQDAISAKRELDSQATEIQELRLRFDGLSSRQREVMELVVVGLSNKEIGARLNISPKTVDHHRAWVMERMGARNLPELVRQAVRLQTGT